MQLRRLNKADLDQIIFLQAQSYEPALCESGEELQKIFPWPTCHGFFVEDKLVAAVYGYVDAIYGLSDEVWFHIYSVEILPEYRNQKLGSQLVELCFAYARSIQAVKLRAWAISDLGYRLLSKFGFEMDGTKILFGKEAKIMLLDLNQQQRP